MHVIHVVRDLEKSSGGLTRAVVQLVEALSDQGVTVSLCYQDRAGEIVDVQESVRRVPVAAANIVDRVLAGRNLVKKLKPIVDNGEPVVCHLHGLWDGMTYAASTWAQRAGIPYVWSVHGMLEPWALQQGRLKKRLSLALYHQRCLENAKRLHATAEMEGKNLLSVLRHSELIVVPNGIPKTSDPNPNLREKSPKVALFLSRVHPKKGLDLLIEAWSRLRPADWVCEIVGPGDAGYIEELKKRVSDKNLQSFMRFFPPMEDDEKWLAYQRASLFVLPTYSENFGIVVAESLAMGTPVLTTTGTPWSSLLEHGCGWYIKPEIDSLETTLRSVFENNLETFEEMGRRGREFATANFEWGAISQQFIDCYEGCLAGRQ